MSQRGVALTVRALSTATLAVAAMLIGASVAVAGGSDAPPPYEVTATGIVLPDGAAFARHGHVNVRWTSATGDGNRNMHLGGPGSAWHDVEGTSAVTWERLGLPTDACIVWVQVHGFNEHFGEGGQRPVCRAAPTPEPAPAPAPPADDAPPAPAPETPTAPEEPESPTPPSEDAPAPVDGPEDAAPRAEPAPVTPPAPALDAPAAGAPTAPLIAVAAAEQPAPLAATGATTLPLVLAAAAAALLGAALLVARRVLGRPRGRRDVIPARSTVD